jgi:hypothetical protein
MDKWKGGLDYTSPPYHPERMTMSKRKTSIWTNIKRFFMRFNMCKCNEPMYEVLNGILSCKACGKPRAWKK